MNKYLASIALILFTGTIMAQRPQREIVELTGTIIEKTSNQPLEFATVIVKPDKGERVYGGMTDRKGRFKVDVPTGNYTISVEFLSFKTYTLASQAIQADKELAPIYMEEDSEALDEVEVIAERSTMEVKLDKKISVIPFPSRTSWQEGKTDGFRLK